MVKMSVGQAMSQKSSLQALIAHQAGSYSQLEQALNQFISSTPNLKGVTYESAKSYASQVLLPLVRGSILLSEAVGSSTDAYVSGYLSQCGGTDLDSEDLERQIAQCDRQLKQLNLYLSDLSDDDRPNPSTLSSLTNQINLIGKTRQRLYDQLRKLHAFNASSTTYFSDLAALRSAVQQGLSQAQLWWQSGSQSFVKPYGQDILWAGVINAKWEETQALALIEKVEAGKDLSRTELNELAGYLVDNPKSKLHDRAKKAFYKSSKLEIDFESLKNYLLEPDLISENASRVHPWFKTDYTITKNLGSAVSDTYTKKKFLKYGKAGLKANEDLKTAWRNVKKYARDSEWEWYAKLGHKWKKGSFNNFINTFQQSKLEKISNFKIGKYSVGKISGFIDDITDPITSGVKKFGQVVSKHEVLGKLKYVGKLAKVAGWVAMAADVGITSVREYNDKDSRAYQSEGKALIHAGIAQLKSAGPIEGAIVGSAVGGLAAPITALIGFAVGTANTLWGVLNPESKDQAFAWLQNKLDDGYDAIANTEFGQRLYQTKEQIKEGIGQAVTSTWDTVTQGFNGGLANVP